MDSSEPRRRHAGISRLLLDYAALERVLAPGERDGAARLASALGPELAARLVGALASGPRPRRS
ncbi:MAG: hypothetical protein ICV74_09920 [Thermoleophilia bacterium]|nr:hypothetical protein [Thermoleophilia bacterium]